MKIKFKNSGRIEKLSTYGHSKTKIVKVRKEHQCSYCGRTISVGEKAYHHSYSDGYRYRTTYICSDDYEIVDDDAIEDPELKYCTCMEGNPHGQMTTSIAGCLVHGTIRSYLYEKIENKYMSCKTCGCSMAGNTEAEIKSSGIDIENKSKIGMEYEDGVIIVQDDESFIHFERDADKHRYWLSDYALNKIQNGDQYILLVSGHIGTGKTMASLSLAEDIDPHFNIDRIAFNTKELLSIMDKGMPEGSVIVWKEISGHIYSRECYEINVMMPSLFEKVNKNKWILIVILESVNHFDNKIRAIVNGFAMTVRIDLGFGWIRYFNVIVDKENKKILHRYPRIKDENGRICVIRGKDDDSGNMKFVLPSIEIMKEYKKKIGLLKESENDV